VAPVRLGQPGRPDPRDKAENAELLGCQDRQEMLGKEDHPGVPDPLAHKVNLVNADNQGQLDQWDRVGPLDRQVLEDNVVNQARLVQWENADQQDPAAIQGEMAPSDNRVLVVSAELRVQPVQLVRWDQQVHAASLDALAPLEPPENAENRDQ